MTQFGIGQPVRRVEDRRFITGRGRYLDDIPATPAHAVFLRRRTPCRDPRVDASVAREALGVVAVLTGADLAADGLGSVPCVSGVAGAVLPPRPAMVADRVRHVGDTVAMVIAESVAAARDAADLIAVDYEPLPVAIERRTRPTPVAARLGRSEEQSQLCVEGRRRRGGRQGRRCRRAQGDADHHQQPRRRHVDGAARRDRRIRRGRGSLYAVELDAGLAFRAQPAGRAVLHIPENHIRVVTPDVGGGFGMKLFLYPEHVLVLWAAKRVGRAVKWVPDHADSFMTAQGRDNVTKLDLALTRTSNSSASRSS